MAGGNGKPSDGLRRGDAAVVDAILDLCSDLRVETLKLEGLARAVIHRRRITDRAFRREFAASVRRIGERHLKAAADVEAELGTG